MTKANDNLDLEPDSKVLHPCQSSDGELDDACEGDDGRERFGQVLETLASLRLRPNQEKVRSTTQRRGSTTKPVMSSERLTISMRRQGTLATAAST
jgi:hypothetical protein